MSDYVSYLSIVCEYSNISNVSLNSVSLETSSILWRGSFLIFRMFGRLSSICKCFPKIVLLVKMFVTSGGWSRTLAESNFYLQTFYKLEHLEDLNIFNDSNVLKCVHICSIDNYYLERWNILSSLPNLSNLADVSENAGSPENPSEPTFSIFKHFQLLSNIFKR